MSKKVNNKDEVERIINCNAIPIKKMLKKLSCLYGETAEDIEDLRQEGWVECMRLAGYYDREKSKSFVIFVYKSVASIIKEYSEQQLKHNGSRKVDFVCANKEQNRLIRDIVDTKLEPADRHLVVANFFNGISLVDIAKELGLTETQVSYRMKGVLSVLKTEFTKVGIHGYDRNRDTFDRVEI